MPEGRVSPRRIDIHRPEAAGREETRFEGREEA